MFHIIINSLVLSLIHAAIPSHWLPLVAIARVERWAKNTTLWATAISGFAHVTSTILIGALVGWAGYKLAATYSQVSRIAAPGVLFLFGAAYIARHFISRDHHHSHFGENPAPNTPFATVVLALSIGMFFSPCIELESYYFTAGTFGWPGIVVVSIVYLLVTVTAMVAFVALALEGASRFNWQFLEKNDKAIIGMVLILAGITTYFVNF